MLDAQPFARKFYDQFSHRFAFVVQISDLRAADGTVLAPFDFGVAAKQAGMGRLE